MSRRIHAGPLSRRCLLALGFVVGGGATMSQTRVPLPGYAAPNVAGQLRMGAEAVTLRSAASAGEYARALSREPHIAGTTTAQARTRD